MEYKRQVDDNKLKILDELQREILCLEESIDDNVVHVGIIGEVRNEIAHDLEDELVALTFLYHQFVLDFSETTFIASMGLKILLDFQKRIDQFLDGNLLLVGVKGDIEQIFHDTGYNALFMIEKENLG